MDTDEDLEQRTQVFGLENPSANGMPCHDMPTTFQAISQLRMTLWFVRRDNPDTTLLSTTIRSREDFSKTRRANLPRRCSDYRNGDIELTLGRVSTSGSVCLELPDFCHGAQPNR